MTYEIVEAKGLRSAAESKSSCVKERLEEMIAQFGLTVFQVTTLTGLADSVRYRMRMEPSECLLEVLYWPVKHRLWVCAGPQGDESVQEIALALAQGLAQVFGGRLETVVQPVVRDPAGDPQGIAMHVTA
ncbi:MAG: hypothetical protein OWU32_04525 [Firmicutes bacterium]|nr:hypothetical protein [Bacillota bacterium]